jgi:hypothetical protein
MNVTRHNTVEQPQAIGHQRTEESEVMKGMRHTRLVECDMTILADTTQEKLNTATLLDTGFVCVAFRNQVFGIPVQYIHLGRGDIDCVYEISTTFEGQLDWTDYGRKTRGT